MDKTLLAISTLLLISKLGLSYGSVINEVKKSSISNSENLSNKKARDIISSFLNAWKTSKIIPEYGRDSTAISRSPSLHVNKKTSPFQLDKLDFLGQRKSNLDGPALYALRNALNPKPIKKQRSRPTNPEAQTFFGKEMDEEEETSPELKLASLVSKPIYHTLPGGAQSSTEEDIKQFMFGNNDAMSENHFGLPNDDWQSSINKRRNLVRIPSPRERKIFANEAEDTAYTGKNENKRNEIIDRRMLDKALRKLRDEIPAQERELIDQQQLRNMFRQNGDKKELITDPYDALSLPVSEFLGGQDIDRKFYKSLPEGLLDEYETSGKIPAQFKLQKNHLWGNIQKRWRRSKINKHPRYSVREDTQERAIGRSFSDGLGETGHTFDAYGQIGQPMMQSSSLVGLNNEKITQPCSNNQELKMDPIAMHNQDNTPEMFVDGAGMQDPSKQVDGGIIQISPDGTPARSRIARPSYDALATRILRNKRSALMLKRKTLQDALARRVKAKASKLALTNKGSTAASRSIHGHYMGGNPDSRGTESEDGITEDNEHSNLDETLAHDATPLLMKIAQGDREDMHKYWSNKHSPGNGFYTGHGEGPNHPYLGDYFGHGPEEMLHDDGIKSLEESASPEDHHTASLIDSIWEHDLGEGHLGEHHLERHHGGLKIKNYFGVHHSPGIMLPTETLDGIDTHWTGHLPHVHSSEYSHTEGHPVDFSPSRIKAIQAIQDDPAIDAEIAPHDGIGIAMGHGVHHSTHGYHHGVGHSYGGMNLAPVVGDPVHVEDSHEDEYKQHIDNLLTQYHGLEEHLRGTDGTLAGHMDPGAFAHHGSHHLHTGYDLYAYKNPWENMKIPYHVPVANHPVGEEEEPPPSPLTFEGKTDEKGAPTDEKGAPIEGGKEEGGKGGPLVEGSKANADKASKGKEGELPKGAKEGGGKMPVIPKQRGGPEVSTGKNETEDATKEKESKGSNDKKERKEEDKENKAASGEKEVQESKEAKEEKSDAKEKQTKTTKENKGRESSKETEGNEKAEKEESGNLSNLVESMMNSTGKQSEMLNNLKTALGDEAKNPKSVAALQLAKLKQLGSMQQALLSSLAKQATKKPTESQPDAEGAGGVGEIKQLLELQQLQQLGAGIKANSLVNTIRQNSLLQSLKAAQENILKNFKTHASLLDAGGNEKQEITANQSPEIQKFFGKLPVKLLGSDLGNVGSEKVASRSHPSNSIENEANIGDLIHTLNTVHAKKPVTSASEASIKPMLSNLLSESLLKTMKNKLKHSSRSNLAKESKEGSQSDKAYSTIGNEGPTSASEDEVAHTRSPHTKDKKKSKGSTKHKKLNEDRELNTPAVEKAEIAPFHEKDFDEDAVSKKDQIKPKNNLED